MHVVTHQHVGVDAQTVSCREKRGQVHLQSFEWVEKRCQGQFPDDDRSIEIVPDTIKWGQVHLILLGR
jgi:hypothetical protein